MQVPSALTLLDHVAVDLGRGRDVSGDRLRHRYFDPISSIGGVGSIVFS